MRRLICLSVWLCVGCVQEAPRASGEVEEEVEAPLVEVVQTQVGRLPLEERVSGVVRASGAVRVRPEISAVVSEVYVRSGEAVTRGQPLVQLDDVALRHQLRQAEAQVDVRRAAVRGAQARIVELDAQVRRARTLRDESLVSDEEVDILEAQLEAARAGELEAQAQVTLAEAQAAERRDMVTRAVVRAPASGRVGVVGVEPGVVVDRATQLFELGNLDRVVVEVPLSEALLESAQVGTLVRVSASGRAPVEVRLSRISPFMARESLSTLGEIDVDNAAGTFYPGMFVAVDVVLGESEEAALAPLSALWEDPASGETGLFVVEAEEVGDGEPEHAVVWRVVEVLAEGRISAGVGGIAGGEWVVSVGQHLLAREDGARARCRPTTWEAVVGLQTRQSEDLLLGFLRRQEAYARVHGAKPPGTDAFLEQGRDAEVEAQVEGKP